MQMALCGHGSAAVSRADPSKPGEGDSMWGREGRGQRGLEWGREKKKRGADRVERKGERARLGWRMR